MPGASKNSRICSSAAAVRLRKGYPSSRRREIRPALERPGETKRLVEFARDNGDLLTKHEKMRKFCLRALYIGGELPELRAELEKDGPRFRELFTTAVDIDGGPLGPHCFGEARGFVDWRPGGGRFILFVTVLRKSPKGAESQTLRAARTVRTLFKTSKEEFPIFLNSFFACSHELSSRAESRNSRPRQVRRLGCHS